MVTKSPSEGWVLSFGFAIVAPRPQHTSAPSPVREEKGQTISRALSSQSRVVLKVMQNGIQNGGTRGGIRVVPAWYPRGTLVKICGTLGIQNHSHPIFPSVGRPRRRVEVTLL